MEHRPIYAVIFIETRIQSRRNALGLLGNDFVALRRSVTADSEQTISASRVVVDRWGLK
jgi:hypothetical protein